MKGSQIMIIIFQIILAIPVIVSSILYMIYFKEFMNDVGKNFDNKINEGTFILLLFFAGYYYSFHINHSIFILITIIEVYHNIIIIIRKKNKCIHFIAVFIYPILYILIDLIITFISGINNKEYILSLKIISPISFISSIAFFILSFKIEKDIKNQEALIPNQNSDNENNDLVN